MVSGLDRGRDLTLSLLYLSNKKDSLSDTQMADSIEQLDTISDTDSEEISEEERQLVSDTFIIKGEAARI